MMDEHKMDDYREEIELMDYFNVLWKRKWLIIIPTLALILMVGLVSFLLPNIWEVDAIIVPSKFTVQTEQGNFEEVVTVPPQQIAGQINEESLNLLISSELNIELKKFPSFKANHLRDTNLIRVSARVKNPEMTKSVLLSLFEHLKVDLDKKADVQMKDADAQIENKENEIQHKNLVIKDNLNAIKFNQIEKNKTRQNILFSGNKLEISKDRVKSIMEEMKTVKKRIDEIAEQQKNALAEKQQGLDAISLLLYSNEIQNNLRYYNTLDEKLSSERITQENLNLLIKEKEEEVKQLDNQIENLNNQIDKIKNEIEDIKNEIGFLRNKKDRIDYARLVKEPTVSIDPVAPKEKLNMVIAGVFGLFLFTFLAFLLENTQKQKSKKFEIENHK
jgi:capsular polysaccharide biosynthesis protein